MKEIFVISLGGSLIVPKEIDVAFLRQFRNFISKQKDKKFIIVVGGGQVSRKWRDAGKKLGVQSKFNLDWIGIKATWLNAELVRAIFGKHAYQRVITDPSKKIIFKEKILVAGGWRPGWSTDYDTVLFAKQFGVKYIINLSNIDYVYNKDPQKFIDARPVRKLNWEEYQKIISAKWLPGANLPFDPIASRLAEKLKLRVVILNGKNLRNLENCLAGRKFKGTTID
jgi:uridylate kinase